MRYKKIEGAYKLTKYIKPMLAQLTDQPAFNNDAWVFEIKWDGYRAIAEVGTADVRLYSRNGLSFAAAYTPVYLALKNIKKRMILDGEIVAFDDDNNPSFQKLQNYTRNSRHPIRYYVFDCLSIDGRDISKLPLTERKRLLKEMLPEDAVVRYCEHVENEGKAFFKEVLKRGLEGMIAKRASSPYVKGARTNDWLKIKNIQSEEAIIIGFTAPKGSRKGFGSLLLGQYKGDRLMYIGNVGTGFTDNILSDLYKKLMAVKRITSPLDVRVKPPSNPIWVDPVFVCNVKFTEKTSDGILRHPVFQGLRIDKKAKNVTSEKPVKGPVRRTSSRKKRKA